jgi:hypothetical protein
MLRTIGLAAAFCLLCRSGQAQSTTRPNYFDRARIRHENSKVIIVANDSLPLFQALYALRLEYGWRVNWESAPAYSRFDLVDDTDPKWRATHPGQKGVTRPSGGLFTASVPEPLDPSDPSAEQNFLAALIQQYDATRNPGRYALQATDPEGILTFVGEQVRDESGGLREMTPLLDTPLEIPKARRNVDETIETLLSALESTTGERIIFASASTSAFRMTQATVGGEKRPARQLLLQSLASMGQPVEYDLFFNPDAPVYILNVSPVLREEDDGVGGRKLVPIGPASTGLTPTDSLWKKP